MYFQLRSCECKYLHVYNIILTYVGVSDLNSTSITNTTVEVMWSHAISPSDYGPVFYYNVTIVNSIDASDMNTNTTSETRADFSDLRNDTDYNISVVAVNRAGTGPSSMITVTTLTGNEGK